MHEKKLAIMSAIFASANFAHSQEKEFTPMGEAQDINSIALVNGQIMVKPTDTNVPYYFVGTNTTDFANSGFACADMTNFTSEVHNDKAVYATRKGNKNKLLTYPLRKNGALNGVPLSVQTNTLAGINTVLSVEENKVFATNTNGELVNYDLTSGTTTGTAIDSLKYKNGDDTYYAKLNDSSIYIYKEGKNKGIFYFNPQSVDPSKSTTPKSLVVLGEDKIYLLTDDGYLYTNNKSIGYNRPIMSGVKSLIATKDGTGYIVSKTDGTVSSYTFNPEGQVKETILAGTKKVASNEFTANGIRYYATGKKLGWSIAD